MPAEQHAHESTFEPTLVSAIYGTKWSALHATECATIDRSLLSTVWPALFTANQFTVDSTQRPAQRIANYAAHFLTDTAAISTTDR